MPEALAAAAEQPIDDIHADVRSAITELSEAPEPVSTPEPKSEVAPEPVETKTAEDRARDEKGRFAPKEEKPVEAKSVEPAKPTEAKPTEQPPTEAKPAEQPAVDAKPVAGPPPGWSVKSKAEWEKIPEHIRADIAKREQEVSQGFAEYAGMKTLKPYVEMARQRGSTLEAALDNYLGIEDLLRRDFISGIELLARNAGINRQQLAAHYSNGAPAFQQPTPDGQVPPIDPALLQQYFNPLQQKVQTLEQHIAQQSQAQQAEQRRAINTALERFVSDPSHRYYANVEPQMAQLIEGGVVARSGDYMADLNTAYEMACNMNPEIRELLFNERITKADEARKATEREAAEKARQASRSITGSPTGGASSDGPDGDGDSVHDAARRAYRQHTV